jgi:hypothetical protein
MDTRPILCFMWKVVVYGGARTILSFSLFIGPWFDTFLHSIFFVGQDPLDLTAVAFFLGDRIAQFILPRQT